MRSAPYVAPGGRGTCCLACMQQLPKKMKPLRQRRKDVVTGAPLLTASCFFHWQEGARGTHFSQSSQLPGRPGKSTCHTGGFTPKLRGIIPWLTKFHLGHRFLRVWACAAKSETAWVASAIAMALCRAISLTCTMLWLISSLVADCSSLAAAMAFT